MSETGKASAMVAFASEQLWPNIHGVVHWYDNEPGVKLTDLYIYVTGNRELSWGPAERLKRFCDAHTGGKVRVHLPEKPLPITPQGAAEVLRGWIAAQPRHDWIINVTGGPKLTFGGVIGLLRKRRRLAIVYRERSGHWYRLLHSASGIETEALPIAAEETDSIPIRRLLNILCEPGSKVKWSEGIEPQPLPIVEVTRAWARHRNWSRAFAEAKVGSRLASGFLFERYLGAVVRALGVKNVRLNLVKRLNREGKATRLQELDVLANYRGKLYFLDCKLGDTCGVGGEATSKQIRLTIDLSRQLGSLGIQTVFVRPHNVVPPLNHLWAEGMGIKVLDATVRRRMFSYLAECFGIEELPRVCQEAEAALREAFGSRGSAPSSRIRNYMQSAPTGEESQDTTRQWEVAKPKARTRNRKKGRKKVAAGRKTELPEPLPPSPRSEPQRIEFLQGRNWSCSIADGRVDVQWRPPADWSYDESTSRLLRAVYGYAVVRNVDFSDDGTECRFSLLPAQGEGVQGIVNFLLGRVHTTLIREAAG